ncbi:hypothetical protein A2397_02045 [Candidatus Amesbacteria bacterium RIFOXYB1_FULL_44_23]|uniref:Repressor LexA n=1 Tax=Candidatus Amesbacteria bacterium RIFOXYB1_FULL_44_23 TaxID=1797263 RepID=A0A1F4ZT69_9BACT|nr:MAG: hypothetical protein A2397_02045 [Candidatus Amesbacteria bacterium RIFOXYB1_FULL_44_23]
MVGLHPRQIKILELLKGGDGQGLSVREIQNLLGISSPSVVQHHIVQLERKGYLRRNPNNPQDFQVLADSPDREVTYLNVYGLAQCGPGGRILDGNPIERVPISSKLLGFSSSEAFMVKAKGDSMVPLIAENDYVVARVTNDKPPGGEIVVAVNDGNATIKKINYSGGEVVLSSINRDYSPMIVSPDFRVEGVVRGVYKYANPTVK